MSRILRPVVAPPLPKWHNPTARVSSAVPPWSKGYTRSYYRSEPLHVPPPHTQARRSPARVISPKERPKSAGPAFRRPAAQPAPTPSNRPSQAALTREPEPVRSNAVASVVAPWDKEPRSLSRGRARPTGHVAYSPRVPFAVHYRGAARAGWPASAGPATVNRAERASPVVRARPRPDAPTPATASSAHVPNASQERATSPAAESSRPAPTHYSESPASSVGGSTVEGAQRVRQTDAMRRAFLRVVMQREQEKAFLRADARRAAEEETAQRARSKHTRAPEIRAVSNFLRNRPTPGRGHRGRRRFASAAPERASANEPASLKEWHPVKASSGAGGGRAGLPEHRRSTPLRPDDPAARPVQKRLPSYLTITPASERRWGGGTRASRRGSAEPEPGPPTAQHYRSADAEIRRVAAALVKASTPLAGRGGQ